jgi:hypothetical protein
VTERPPRASTQLLVVFCGLPGTGKSTLAAPAARVLRAPLFSKDVLEAALMRSGMTSEMGSGFASYEQLTALAEAQLQQGLSVVLDSVGTYQRVREEWRRPPRQPAATGGALARRRRSAHARGNCSGRLRATDRERRRSLSGLLSSRVSMRPVCPQCCLPIVFAYSLDARGHVWTVT